jgi:hypothetical protein
MSKRTDVFLIRFRLLLMIPSLASIVAAYVCFRCLDIAVNATQKYKSGFGQFIVIVGACITVGITLFNWIDIFLSAATTPTR